MKVTCRLLTLAHAGRRRGGDGQWDPDAAASAVLPAAAATAAATGVEERKGAGEEGGGDDSLRHPVINSVALPH